MGHSSKTPEAAELELKLSELADLENELIQRELDLATLQAELHAFEREYIRIIGTRYAELDEIEAQIADFLAKQNPKNSKAQNTAETMRGQAKESQCAIGDPNQKGRGPREFKPSDDLKKLYREIAKSLHPDLTTDEEERLRRQQFMADANQAYEDGDEERLRAILSEWESSPESVEGGGIGADLIRTIRKIAQVRNRLTAIQNQLECFKISEIFQLKMKVAKAKEQGQDLIKAMADELNDQIRDARNRLGKLRGKGYGG